MKSSLCFSNVICSQLNASHPIIPWLAYFPTLAWWIKEPNRHPWRAWRHIPLKSVTELSHPPVCHKDRLLYRREFTRISIRRWKVWLVCAQWNLLHYLLCCSTWSGRTALNSCPQELSAFTPICLSPGGSLMWLQNGQKGPHKTAQRVLQGPWLELQSSLGPISGAHFAMSFITLLFFPKQ